MSTKVYCAYKLKDPRRLWPLVHDIRLQGTKNVKTTLTKLYEGMMPDVKTDTQLFTKRLADNEGNEWVTRHSIVQDTLKRLYKFSSMSMERSLWDFNVSVAFREWQGQIYLIPHCDMLMREVLDFLGKDKRLKEYHYQNQSDRPESISRQAWSARKKVWEGLLDHGADKWQDVLVLNICAYDFYYLIDPWLEMRQARHKSRKTKE